MLSAGSATLLAAITVIGVSRDLEPTVVYVALGWWAVATVVGAVLGRRADATPPIARLLATARTQSTLPDVRPGATLINRLWPLLLSSVAAAGSRCSRRRSRRSRRASGSSGRSPGAGSTTRSPPSRSATACASTSTGPARCADPAHPHPGVRRATSCASTAACDRGGGPGCRIRCRWRELGANLLRSGSARGQACSSLLGRRRLHAPPPVRRLSRSPVAVLLGAPSPRPGARRPPARPGWPPTGRRPTGCGRSSTPSGAGSTRPGRGWRTPRPASPVRRTGAAPSGAADRGPGQARPARIRLTRLQRREIQARRTLADNLAAAYKSGKPTIVTVVLNSNGFADLLGQVEFLKRVSRRNATILDETREARAAVKRQTDDLERLQTPLQRARQGGDRGPRAGRRHPRRVARARGAPAGRRRDGVASRLATVRARIGARSSARRPPRPAAPRRLERDHARPRPPPAATRCPRSSPPPTRSPPPPTSGAAATAAPRAATTARARSASRSPPPGWSAAR